MTAGRAQLDSASDPTPGAEKALSSSFLTGAGNGACDNWSMRYQTWRVCAAISIRRASVMR